MFAQKHSFLLSKCILFCQFSQIASLTTNLPVFDMFDRNLVFPIHHHPPVFCPYIITYFKHAYMLYHAYKKNSKSTLLAQKHILPPPPPQTCVLPFFPLTLSLLGGIFYPNLHFFFPYIHCDPLMCTKVHEYLILITQLCGTHQIMAEGRSTFGP